MNGARFRPPAEAHSVILQTDIGCPHNRCTFCGMYKDLPYRRRSIEEIDRLAADASRCHPAARRLFLADGDVMNRPFEQLDGILACVGRRFPKLARVNLYANGRSIGSKSDAELRALRAHRLQTLYLGLESGDDRVLERCRKGETAAAMVSAARRAQAAGLRVSVMVLLGLGGPDGSGEHACKTARALNHMQPRLLSALRVIPVPGTTLYDEFRRNRFAMLSERQVVEELRALVEHLELKSTIFRADHASNVLPLQGRLPGGKAELLAELDALLRSGRLDPAGPGRLPAWL